MCPQWFGINHISVDGVIQNSPEDGFPYTDWGGPYWSPEGRDFVFKAYGERYDALIEHGLVDELVLLINPVLVGTGKRLFAEGTPGRTFELVNTTALASGIVVCNYTLGEPLPLVGPPGRHNRVTETVNDLTVMTPRRRPSSPT